MYVKEEYQDLVSQNRLAVKSAQDWKPLYINVIKGQLLSPIAISKIENTDFSNNLANYYGLKKVVFGKLKSKTRSDALLSDLAGI